MVLGEVVGRYLGGGRRISRDSGCNLLVDGDLFLTPSSLAVYLQDAAILHSDSIGYTIDYFNNEKKGWVIINWHI